MKNKSTHYIIGYAFKVFDLACGWQASAVDITTHNILVTNCMAGVNCQKCLSAIKELKNKAT